MQSIRIIGTPYERGRQHGEKFARLIREKSIGILSPKSADCAETDRVLRYFEKHLEKQYPPYLEEIRGIADGSRIAYLDILRLNGNVALVGLLL